ncbi:UNKNOWN [Stylonychia lemnae]|uniref:Uncharacterized protein n=1 Tax=Stylonychia lemnae TaxID=5949 RepID=A0A078B8T2_STYLE|nr:UNKNOWN [Stylonychia lemnae]|eukprot:CDW90824.1 UNKNOWN [Stylonychia lemnae]
MREDELMKNIKPFNALQTIMMLSNIANLTVIHHDQRFDLNYEKEDDPEPKPAAYDNFVANIEFKQRTRQMHFQREMVQSDSSQYLGTESRMSSRRLMALRRQTSKLTHTLNRRSSFNISEKSSPDNTGRKKNKDHHLDLALLRQIKLDPPEKKPYEILDDQTQNQIERLRNQQRKKEQLREYQKKRSKQKVSVLNRQISIQKRDLKEDSANNTMYLSDLHFFNTNESISNLFEAKIHGHEPIAGQKVTKVRTDRLPKQYSEAVKTYLGQNAIQQETDLSKLLKAIQMKRQEEKNGMHNFDITQNNQSVEQQVQDLDNLMQSNGLRSNQVIQLLDYQVPLRKILQMNYGVIYREKQAYLQGENYSKKPSTKTQHTREQFYRLSNQVERRYLRSNELIKSLTRLFKAENMSQRNTPNSFLTPMTPNTEHSNHPALQSQQKKVKFGRTRTNSRSKINISSPEQVNSLYELNQDELDQFQSMIISYKEKQLNRSSFQLPNLNSERFDETIMNSQILPQTQIPRKNHRFLAKSTANSQNNSPRNQSPRSKDIIRKMMNRTEMQNALSGFIKDKRSSKARESKLRQFTMSAIFQYEH